MKPIKGLDLDNRPSDISEGFCSYAKNVIKRNGRLETEKGLEFTDVTLPYPEIGKVEADDVCILFLTNNTNSEIGTFNYLTLEYKTILNDSSLPYKLNFNTNSPIKGEWQRNFKRELIVAFKDNINPPRIINITNNKANDINDYLLFPYKKKASIKTTVTSDGDLKKGSYTPFLRYIKDGNYTDYFMYGKPVTIGKETRGSINIRLTNLDTRYKQVELGFIQVNDGITTVVSLYPKDITTIVNFTYSGVYKYELSLEEVLAVSAHYTKAGVIGQYNDELFLSDLEEYNMDKINFYMQQAACNMELRVKSELIQDVVRESESLPTQDTLYISTSFTNNLNTLGGAYKTLMHQEVYAFYIKATLKNGLGTVGYIIPNRALTTNDRTTSAQWGNYEKFRVEDTCSVDTDYMSDNVMKFGVWENTNETYPNKVIEGYGNPFGSLAGQNVRHFKTPSHHFCNANFYDPTPDVQYGITSLDVLKVIVKSFTIPAEIEDDIENVELCFAKRSGVNITNLGQSLYLCGANSYTGFSDPNPSNAKDITSTGGNFHYAGYGIDSLSDVLKFDETCLRFHAFDLMNNNPSVVPNILVNQIKLKKGLMKTYGTFGRENVLNRSETDDTSFNETFKERSVYQIIDYVTGNIPETDVPSVAEKFRTITGFKRLPANTYTGDFDNRLLEGCYVARLSQKSPKTLEVASQITTYPSDTEGNSSFLTQTISGRYDWIDLPRFEITYLSNAIRVVLNMYENFDNQELIPTGLTFGTVGSTRVEGIVGDSYISDYSFVTYGKRGFRDNAKDAKQGTRFIHRFLCETSGNANLRYEKTGDDYSRIYPKSDGNWIKNLDKSNEPNLYGYDKEFNQLNIYESVLPFNISNEPIYSHPYRIIRSSPNSREKGIRSWQNFAPLDYYEMEKSYGEVKNITTLDDRLIIHTSRAIFITREKARLNTDILSVVLGSGDIFDFNPVKMLDLKEGFGGLSNDVSVCTTPLGYMFVDLVHKTPFIFKESLKSVSNACYVFFQEFLSSSSNNPYNDKGVVIGYDMAYRRLLLTYRDSANSGFTMSYCIDEDNWISFHDYLPDMYIQNMNMLFSIKDKKIYKHNVNISGRYYNEDVKPFIIDVPFVTGRESVLEAVSWISESISNTFKGEMIDENITFDSISARTLLEHTGDVKLYKNSWIDKNYDKIGIEYATNELLNKVERNNKPFIDSIQKDLNYKPIDEITEWFYREQLRSNYFIIRLKSENKKGYNLSLLDVNIKI